MTEYQNSNLCDALTHPIPSSIITWKTNSLPVTVVLKAISLGATGIGREDSELQKSSFPRELSLYYPSGSSLDTPHSQGLSSSDMTQNLLSENSYFPRTIFGKCKLQLFNIRTAWVMIKLGEDKRMTRKNLKGKMGNEMSIVDF